jgi:hypothetical protein
MAVFTASSNRSNSTSLIARSRGLEAQGVRSLLFLDWRDCSNCTDRPGAAVLVIFCFRLVRKLGRSGGDQLWEKSHFATDLFRIRLDRTALL